MILKLPETLKLGAATASTQIEGGDKNNNWYDWFKRGKIKDGFDPSIADDHYNRVEEDLNLMESLNIQIYRFGIEWSRIQPHKDVFDKKAILHYRSEIEGMLSRGILPLLTLHHFNNPMWLENEGGFENEKIVEIFSGYVAYVVEELGDLVSEWITINEPNVYVTNSYYFGEWPPGVKSFKRAMNVYNNFAKAHIAAYNLIHKIRRQKGYDDTKVGYANHVRIFKAKNRLNPVHLLNAALLRKFFQTSIDKAMMTGKISFPLKRDKSIKKGKYYDFIGINYYSRSTVSKLADGVKKNVSVNDLGWEIYPDGLKQISEKLYKKYKAPVYITENGTCDNSDAFRCRYIYDHLKAIKDCPFITRYYHWTLMDNFEWIEGVSARFGLVNVDFTTQKRTIKQSGKFYAEIIKKGGVDEKMYDKYVSIQKYKTNS